MPRPGYQIYEEEMILKSHGFPVWFGDPYGRAEIKMGDIGYMSNGMFVHVKNCDFDFNEPMITPVDFNGPVYSQSLEQRGGGANAEISTPAGAGATSQISLTSSRNTCAMLNVEEGVADYIRCSDVDKETVGELFRKNARTWIDEAVKARQIASNISIERLILVTGFYKSANWEAAVLSSSSSSGNLSFTIGASQVGGGISFNWDSVHHLSPDYSTGHRHPLSPSSSRPGRRSSAPTTDSNNQAPGDTTSSANNPAGSHLSFSKCCHSHVERTQCIFLRGFRIRERLVGKNKAVELLASEESNLSWSERWRLLLSDRKALKLPGYEPSHRSSTAYDNLEPIEGFPDTNFCDQLYDTIAVEKFMKNDSDVVLVHDDELIETLERAAAYLDIEPQSSSIIPHISSIGATSVSNKYPWRTADGSFNNIDIPDLGKAGTPYSRLVQRTHPLPCNQLPDAGLIFDTLLRREGFEKHPGGLSSLMFSFTSLFIHSVSRTSHRNCFINETSSYLDLAPLYGSNTREQDRVRVRDGRGKLHPDTFADDSRFLLFPPAVSGLLILFNRNHNYVAAKLLDINERGAYVDPDDPSTVPSREKLIAQEEEIFQTARLINCGWFAMILFSDYFSAILGLARDRNDPSLNPFAKGRSEDHSAFEGFKGNQRSVEFDCVYRWHATTSLLDEKWTDEMFTQLFHKPMDQVDIDELKSALIYLQRIRPEFTFGNFQRQQNGIFQDHDLANILHNATEHRAAAFKARGTPSIMRLNEIMAIEQDRKWDVCSLNDFRKYLGLKPYSTFLEWNSDPKIATAAENLYGDVNYLELYVGLQAEEAKPPVDGAGLCSGHTIERTILSDAIALTCGDRFFTCDFTPHNLTAWGFADCQMDPNASGFGSTLGRLFLRTLPNNYTANSIYTFFPFMTPESMKTNLTRLGVIDRYDLSRPKSTAPTVTIEGYAHVAAILKNKKGFTAPYKARVDRVIHSTRGFFPVESDHEQQAILSVLSSPEFLDDIGKYFYGSTKELIKTNSYDLVGGEVHGIDLVRQVLKVLPVNWVATDLAGIQLKTAENPDGEYTAAELYDILGEIYSYIFLDVEASKVITLQAKVKTNMNKLLQLIKSGVAEKVDSSISVFGSVETLSNMSSKFTRSANYDILEQLYKHGPSTDQLANTILALMVIVGVELVLAMTNTINYCIGIDHAKMISMLAKADKNNQLDEYVYEALRLDPIFRVSSTIDLYTVGRHFDPGDIVFLNTASANLDESIFPNPTTFNVARSTKERLFTDGIFKYLGQNLTVKIVSEVLRAVFELRNVRRAPGQSGFLKRFKNPDRPELCYSYLNTAQLPSEWPTSMSIQFDTNKDAPWGDFLEEVMQKEEDRG